MTPHPSPAHLDLTLDLHVLNDENFTDTDDIRHHSRHHLTLTTRPHSHRHYLRLGGSRSLTLTCTCPPEHGRYLAVRADLHETHPAPSRARHHTLLQLTPGTSGRHVLHLHLPGDPQPYGHLTISARLLEQPTDPSGALDRRAAELGWMPTRLHTIPGGHQLNTDQGELYHDGQHVHALHAQAALAYQQRGGPTGPLGLPRADALGSRWTLPLTGHVLTQSPGGPAALLTTLSWTHWQHHAASLGPAVSDTTPLHRGQLDVTACQTGTLITDPATGTRVPARTLRISPGRVTRWVQDQLIRHLPPGTTALLDQPWPGPPLRYPLALHVTPWKPIDLVIPLALRISPAPDARRPVQLNARQAGLITLPAGVPVRHARLTLQLLQDILNRPLQLASLPAGNRLVGAQMTPDGGLHLDFLPADYHKGQGQEDLTSR